MEKRCLNMRAPAYKPSVIPAVGVMGPSLQGVLIADPRGSPTNVLYVQVAYLCFLKSPISYGELL